MTASTKDGLHYSGVECPECEHELEQTPIKSTYLCRGDCDRHYARSQVRILQVVDTVLRFLEQFLTDEEIASLRESDSYE